MSADDLGRRIDAARERKAAGQAEIEAANREFGECFGDVLDEDLDLKAHAKRADVSRTTAYDLAERYGDSRR